MPCPRVNTYVYRPLPFRARLRVSALYKNIDLYCRQLKRAQTMTQLRLSSLIILGFCIVWTVGDGGKKNINYFIFYFPYLLDHTFWQFMQLITRIWILFILIIFCSVNSK